MKPVKLFIEAYPISEPHISGIGHMTLELIRALEKHPENQKSFEIVLVINKDRKNMLERWQFKATSIKTIPLLPTRLFNLIWKFDMLPPMDILIGRGVYLFPNYKNWRLLFSKSLTYVCDISYLLYPQYVSPKNQKFLKKNIFKWVRRADKVLTISKSAQEEIIQNLHIDKSKTLLLTCGVDTRIFYKRKQIDIVRFKSQYNITKDYILYLGNIEPRKNIVKLIEAYKLLPEKLREEYSLVIVGGGGWLNEPIMEAIKMAQHAGYNIVKPDAYIPEEDLPVLQSGATILVHPALYEGFGISTLQAMACETPVIAGNNSSMVEVIGDAGLLVDVNNVKSISATIGRLLRDLSLRKRLSKKGMEQVKRYKWEDTANKLVQLIKSMN